ncbi:CTP-dependent diacylglycerol kinase [Acrasis kona]|uniref:CTP-dependent diacylglycerol kinase n=1 Tax=Acrasis kona TaxID=1008807 RepID=A0AAW2ZEN5_9EUKA
MASPVQIMLWVLLVLVSVSIVLAYLLRGKAVKQSVQELLGVGKKKVAKLLSEFRRKTFHLLGLLVPVIYYASLKRKFLTQWQGVAIVGSIASIMLLVDILRLTVPAFNNLFIKSMGGLMRKKEQERINGSTYYMIGCAATMALFNPTIAIVSLLFLDLGDLMAALVGLSFGRIKIYGGKSLEGCIACFLTCCVVGLIGFSNVRLSEYITVAGALAATLTELFFDQINDNLTIPLVSGLVMTVAKIRLGVSIPLY